ncbi:MAG TPA: nuclear transport factor 2 family protein [Chitinophagaceae bacterium]|nr:nuclear transport factor 2 family protein [Chitinophagaceae bacterium]
MKKIALIIFLLTVLMVNGQSSKDEQALVERAYLLSHTVFGTKDSMTLEDLFASTATYGHSHGKLQTRKEAIDGISHNQSTYSDTALSNIQVIFGDDDVAIVRHLFKASEHTKDGKVVPLNFSMMLVWVKEKKKWRLFGRQAVSLQ